MRFFHGVAEENEIPPGSHQREQGRESDTLAALQARGEDLLRRMGKVGGWGAALGEMQEELREIERAVLGAKARIELAAPTFSQWLQAKAKADVLYRSSPPVDQAALQDQSETIVPRPIIVIVLAG